MTRARLHALLFVGWLGLVFLALRPVPPLERAVDAALSPLRILAELTAPLRWVRRPEVRAAEEELRTRAERDQRERDELERALREIARPDDPALVAGRLLVDAEVVGRTEGDLDELVIRLAPGAPVERGLPVVWGSHYVGRVTRVEDRGARARVRLVTSRGFFVGGAVRLLGGGEVQMIVGGLDHPPAGVATGGAAYLVVHNPSDREVGERAVVDPADPTVVVHELLASPDEGEGLEPFGRLAEGFRLGRLVRAGAWVGVEPGVDFRSGLFQVTVLAPAGSAAAGPVVDVLADGRWQPVRPLSSGDPDARRAGLKISAGTLGGVEPGAALVHGSYLVGRVTRSGPLSADVALLADPGFELVVLARVDVPGAAPEVRALGRMTSLGPHPEGGVLLRWDVVVPLAPSGGAPFASARLFTGSGERGLPRGLFVGRAELPTGPPPASGHHLVRLEPSAGGLGLGNLWVRRTREAAAEARP